ncbi:M16 family metallopeptidase [Myxococcus landrumensis]|uniref:Insulinase family protein n=1 Tax=Myxococcus landrumensis TaxID=2813577 RepID=A0ABX7MY56_9BACT|nr:pitrilysin family protein [Myxococcus landrumus]QSQ11226.1 insulinase family protein [Myxococcus landrumus]
MFRQSLLWTSCLTLLAAPAAIAQAPAKAASQPAATSTQKLGSNVESRTFKNGLKVIVWPDHDIPNVTLNNWFRVGSRNEYPGITGLSHFFEHMMFNGAKKFGPGEFDRVMEANGGANNAFTSEDVTVYQDWFPRTALDVIFQLEADRLQFLSFDPKVVESERGVVYSERRSSVDNNNMVALMEQVQATAFVAHPYQFPVIGWPSDIESWRLEDLQRYFKTYYAPNNGTLVFTGAVTPAEIFALVEKYLEPIPAQPPPEPIRTKEPEQQGERRIVLKKLAQSPLLQFAYQGMAAKDADVEALTLLLNILGDGDSSRLHRRLVEEERAAINVATYFSPGFDPSLVWVTADLAPNGNLARVEALLTEELARVVKNGVTEAELSKARNITLANFWRSLETINTRAYALGAAETFRGDYRQLFDAPARYERVTREDLRKVAERIFSTQRRTVGWLVPTEEAAATTPAARKDATR